MKIHFFHWSQQNGPGIYRGFIPLIEELKKEHTVKEFFVPYIGSNPINLLKNIYFIHHNKSKTGVNHITGDIHYGILGLIGSKSVLTIHDDYAMVKAKGGIVGKIYKWLFWIYLPILLSDATVCITPETRMKIKRWYNSSKISCITHHVVDKKITTSTKKFNKENPRILQVGTDVHKNLETTMKVFSSIPCELHILKKMTEEQHCLARNLNLNYTNLYNLTDDEVNKEYDEADIIVFPSQYEGLGLPILEAQTAGKALITSDIAPMNWVAGKDACLLINPNDTIEYDKLVHKILEDQNFREQLINNGLINVKRFNIIESTTSYLNLYNTL